MTLAGFPHSEICGLTVECTYPQLIAADHVLHRLLTPRHSPYALNILLYTITIIILRYSTFKVPARITCEFQGLSLEDWILVIEPKMIFLNLGTQALTSTELD